MKSLTEYNEEKLKYYNSGGKSGVDVLNNIACPNCGDELCDKDINIQTLSRYPMTRVICHYCGYVGLRYI